MEPYIHARSYTIPAWDLKTDTKRDYQKAAIDVLTKRAVMKLGIEHLNIRELKPEDLGLTSWKTPPLLANRRVIWINHETKRRQFIAIYGLTLFSESPKVTSMRIGAGCSGSTILGLHEFKKLMAVLPIIKKLDSMRDDRGWLLETFGLLENIRMEGYFAEPYIYDDKYFIWIEVLALEDNEAGDEIALTGFVAELVGETIA